MGKSHEELEKEYAEATALSLAGRRLKVWPQRCVA